MAEQARKHDVRVFVGVRNIDQQRDSQVEQWRAIEVNEDHSKVEITYENDPIVEQVDQEQQTSDREQYHLQREYVNDTVEQFSKTNSSSQQPARPEPATRKRRLHHLGELTEEQEEGEDEEQEEAHDVSHNYMNQDHPAEQDYRGQEGNAKDCQEMAPEQQLNLLRDLLRIERHNSEQRRENNHILHKYIEQLQADYLRQQSELVQALEFSHKLKGQKDSQLACLESSLGEKDSLIGQLKTKLASLDETQLREEFKQALDKQRELKQVEHDQLRAQVEAVEQQLASERARGAQLAGQFQDKLDDQLRLHEKELVALRARLTSVQEDLERVLSEPQNLVIRALREEKSQLSTRADELQLAVQEGQSRCESIKRKLDDLLSEQKRAAEEHQAGLDQAQAQQAAQRRALQELKLELEDKEEVSQILQFNLARSEKRVKNLLGSLKAKEATYRELIGAHETKHQQEVERLKSELQASEKQLIEFESELGKKQNELVRLQLAQDNQLESLRNDRDERVRKLTQEKVALEREQQATELRCARELELARETAKQVDQLKGELEQLRAEGKRISIELTKSEAKLYAKQQELNQVTLRVQQLEQQQQQAAGGGGGGEQQVNRLTRDLDTERNMSKRFKAQLEELSCENEKLCVKLKIAETNVDKMSTVLRREHAKMMLEHEKRLEQIRNEQVVFDKNKLRYKRYGYKLKRYCEHLRRVHEHLCSPANCGYTITSPGDFRANNPRADRVSLLSCGAGDSDESQDGYEEIYEEIDEADEGEGTPLKSRLTSSSRGARVQHSPDRFLIKRTGGGCGGAIPSPQQQLQQQQQQQQQAKLKSPLRDTSRQHQQYPRTPLKARRTNQRDKDQDNLFARTVAAGAPETDFKQPRRPSSWQANENQDDRHAYYYIRANDKLQTPTPPPPSGLASRGTSATSRSLTPVSCRQTKLSLARAKVRQQKQQQQQQLQLQDPRMHRSVI